MTKNGSILALPTKLLHLTTTTFSIQPSSHLRTNNKEQQTKEPSALSNGGRRVFLSHCEAQLRLTDFQALQLERVTGCQGSTHQPPLDKAEGYLVCCLSIHHSIFICIFSSFRFSARPSFWVSIMYLII